MKRVFFGALLSAVSLSAVADPYSYQVEVGGNYEYVDGGLLDKDDSFGVFGTYYFSPVQLEQHAYGEAAFLERASFVTLDAGYSDNSRDSAPCAICTGALSNEERQDYALTVGGYIANTILYSSATYAYRHFEAEYTDDRIYSDSRTTWSAELGVAPLEGWLLTTGFSEYAALFEHGWNVSSKYVGELDNGRSYNVEGTYSDIDNGPSSWTVGGDFYFMRAFSIGGTLGEHDYYTLRSRWFVTPDVSLSLKMVNSEELGYVYYEEPNYYTLELTGRF